MSNNLLPVVYDSVNAQLFAKNPIAGLQNVPSHTPPTDPGIYNIAIGSSEFEGKFIEFDRPTRSLLWLIPDSLNGGFFGMPRPGTRINIIQLGPGSVEVWTSYEDPVTILSQDNKRTLSGQYAQATLYFRGDDTWYLSGDLINDSLNYDVVNSGTASYDFTGEGLTSASNPALSLDVYQEIVFNVDAPGHPFWIKTTLGGGPGADIPDGALEVVNNGTSSGTIRARFFIPGTYYYVCQFHSASMNGSIVVS